MKRTLSEIIMLAAIAPRHEPSVELNDGTVLLVRRPTDEEIENIHSLTQSEIAASSTPLPIIKGVHKHNKDSFWGVYQASDASPEAKRKARFIGYYAMLHLNQAGLDALERDEFDASDPPHSLLAASGERPAAIYVWAVVARRVARIATPLIARALGKQTYGGLPIYTTAGTLGGLHAIKGYGFLGARQAEGGLGHLFRLDPPAPVPRRTTEAA
jgi:hypothetical protein